MNPLIFVSPRETAKGEKYTERPGGIRNQSSAGSLPGKGNGNRPSDLFTENLTCHCVKPINSLGLQGLDLIQEDRKLI